MHDFIMGKRQDEVLVEGIKEAESEGVVMIFPVQGIFGHI